MDNDSIVVDEEWTGNRSTTVALSRSCPTELPTVVQYLNGNWILGYVLHPFLVYVNDIKKLFNSVAGLDTAVTVIIAITIVLSFATFVICGKNIRQVLRYTPKRFKSKTIVVLIIYPVSANDVA